MQLIFYKTDDIAKMLILLLTKGRKQGLTFNLFCVTGEECENLSKLLWNSSSNLIHGQISDGFYEMQPILVTTQNDFHPDTMQKDCAIIISQACLVSCEKWQKICFVNVDDAVREKYRDIEHLSWEYKNEIWTKL